MLEAGDCFEEDIIFLLGSSSFLLAAVVVVVPISTVEDVRECEE